MAEMLLLNPKRRKRKTTKRKTTKRKSVARRTTPTRKKRAVKRRRNPIRKKGIAGIIQETLMPSAVAAGGALGLDVMMAYLPVPENLKTGPMRHVASGVGAIGMGMLASMFLKAKTAELITTGAMTVVMHNAGKEAIQKFAPDIQLASAEDEYEDLSYVSPGMPVGEYLNEYVSDDNGMNAYLNGLSIEDELEL